VGAAQQRRAGVVRQVPHPVLEQAEEGQALSEVWVDIPGTNYQVSNQKRVRLIKYVKPTVGPTGYWEVALSVPGRNRSGMMYRRLHRLLAEAFIPNPEKKLFVNHRDGNKLNADLSNLEWNSPRENVKHAYRLGLILPTRGRKNGQAKLQDCQVACMREFAGLWKYRSMARHFGVCDSVTRDILSNRAWLHLPLAQRPYIMPQTYGEQHPSSKPTAAQVQEIRKLKGTALQREIAARFGVSTSTIQFIYTGHTWRDADGGESQLSV
jgi:hypothetical protein